jgi:putative glutamine amidotransferase
MPPSPKAWPLIGISCTRKVGGAWGLVSRGHFMDYCFDEYSRAVLACKGVPVLIPVAQNDRSLAALLERLDGVILSGGPDLHPRTYGEEPAAGLGQVDSELDVTELALTRAALDRDLPLLAICRGLQVLNVALGGSLFQDIDAQVSGSLNHRPSVDKGVATHRVRIESGTRLHTLLGRRRVWVNGRHHQAVNSLGNGLTMAALSSDGVVEAVELPDKRFVVGVQWHPEGTWQTDPLARKLFRALVRAAARR